MPCPTRPTAAAANDNADLVAIDPADSAFLAGEGDVPSGFAALAAPTLRNRRDIAVGAVRRPGWQPPFFSTDRETGMQIVTAIDHVVLNVRDVEVSAAWYARVLGMTRHDFQPPHGVARTRMKFGSMMLNLRPVDFDQAAWFTGAEAVAGSDDLCFLTDLAVENVMRHFAECQVEVEVGPVARRGARGEMTSLYCRDPDGNLIEVAKYG